MKIAGLVDALNLFTDIPWTEWSWSEAPKDGYGVVTADGQSELKADADPVAEKMMTGYVDAYVKATDPDPTDDVEAAMQALGVWFRMESIQFEPETGYLHFEWRWTDTLRKAGKAINLDELPIVLHVTGTEETTSSGGQTYRKILFADGEPEKVFETAKTRDVCFGLEYWVTGAATITYWMRKTTVKEDVNNTTEIVFESIRPEVQGYPEEGTISAYSGMQVAFIYQDGTFKYALATHYTD